MPLFSIITPCFNSAATLRETYRSLLSQSSQDFEWILVDDASTDCGETTDLIRKIQSEAPFNVKSFFLEKNYFGSRSVFSGCTIAAGQYVAILDHDDQLTPAALSIVARYIERYREDESIAGICGRCVNEHGKLIGEKFVTDEFVAREGDVRFTLGMTRELFQFSKLPIIMPLFEAMRPGYTNGFVWAQVATSYKYVFVNDVVRIYDTALPTSYSNTSRYLVKFPDGKADALRATIISYRQYLSGNFMYSSQLIGSYLRHALNSRRRFRDTVRGFDVVLKCWCVLMYPAAILKAKGLIR